MAADRGISPLRIVVFANNSPRQVFSITVDDRLNGTAAEISTKLGS